MALSLKCGGTLEQRAERLFSTKGRKIEELPAKLFCKSKSVKKYVMFFFSFIYLQRLNELAT